MKITVVIPAHNEEDFVADILQSVERQTRPPDCVVVSCDACTDKTEAVARRILASRTNRKIETVVIAVDCRSIAGARNRGMEAAPPDTDAFLCVDSDSLLSPNTLAEMETALARGFDFGSFRLVLDGRFDARRRGLDLILANVWLFGVYFSNRVLGNFVGTGVFFRRGANSGYDESWGWAEDIELCERMRRRGKRWTYIRAATLAYCDRRFVERGYFAEILQRMRRGMGHYRKPRAVVGVAKKDDAV